MTDNNNNNNNRGELYIDRSHIDCDYCDKPGPTKNCSRCCQYYYCNRQCQVNHWKDHKHMCSILKCRHDRYKDEKRREKEFLEEIQNGKREDKEPAECAICLEEIELPISLECGHVFCVSCLLNYHAANEKSSCPNCRGDIDKNLMSKEMSMQTNVYIERARISHGSERDVYLNLALRQVDASFDVRQFFDDEQDYKATVPITTMYPKIIIFEQLDMHREVIDTVDEFIDLLDTNTNVNFELIVRKAIDGEKIVEARIAKARAHLKLEEWQTALDLFKSLYEDCKEQHKKYCSVILAGISRAQYELQNYHEASLEGCRASYRDHRYNPGIHKYVALSRMKLGDFEGAKISITRGILHEELWNEENKKENEDVFRLILAEEAKNNNKSKGKKKGNKKKGRGKK